MVKVLRSIVRGPLAPFGIGFAEELLLAVLGRPARVFHRASGPLDAGRGSRARGPEWFGDRALPGAA